MTLLAQVFVDPPLLERWLLMNPWPVVVPLLAVAVVFRLRATGTGRPRLNWGALIAVLAAVGVWALATAVTTPREQVDAATRGLLRATVSADAAAIDRFIEPTATVLGPEGRAMTAGAGLAGELTAALGRHPIRHHRVNDLGTRPVSADTVLVRLDLRTTFEATGFPNATVWLITWRRNGASANWRVAEIQWLQWQGERPPGAVWRQASPRSPSP